MPERNVTIRLNALDNFSATLDAYTLKLGEAEAATQRVNTATQTFAGLVAQIQPNGGAALTQPGMTPALPGGGVFEGANPLAGLFGSGGDSDESGGDNDLSGLVGGLGEIEAALTRASDRSADLKTQLSAARTVVSEGLNTELGAAASVTERIAGQFAKLTNAVQVIKVKIEVDDPRGVLPYLRGGGAFDLAQTVRDAGGTVPGAQDR